MTGNIRYRVRKCCQSIPSNDIYYVSHLLSCGIVHNDVSLAANLLQELHIVLCFQESFDSLGS